MSQLDSVLKDLDASSREIERLEQEIDQLAAAGEVLIDDMEEQREHLSNAWHNLATLVPAGSVAFGRQPDGAQVAVCVAPDGTVTFRNPKQVLDLLALLVGA